jgi:hypothetical protein
MYVVEAYSNYRNGMETKFWEAEGRSIITAIVDETVPMLSSHSQPSTPGYPGRIEPDHPQIVRGTGLIQMLEGWMDERVEFSTQREPRTVQAVAPMCGSIKNYVVAILHEAADTSSGDIEMTCRRRVFEKLQKDQG